MSADGLLAILPFLVLAAGAVAAMLSIAVQRDHRIVATIAAATLFLALAALAVAARHAPRQVTPLLVVDGYALYYLGIVLASALAVTVLSYGYFAARYAEPREEYYVLLLLATLGAAVMTAGSHFAAFFLGLETLSIALIGLIAYPRSRARPLEAGIKYLMLSGVSSAFLLFGIALVYAVLGTLPFAGGRPPAPAGGGGIYWIAGLAMILVGIGFKLSVVPFHLWAPDVYEGAPAPVTAFVAVVSKCAVFALLLRYFIAAGAFAAGPLAVVLSVIAVLSMIAGNLLALLQDNVKRILAYSSIAHLGYALVAFLASGALAIEAVSMYLAAYAITTVGAFGVVTLLSAAGDGRDADLIDEYRGLFWRRPWLAVTFAAMLLSLAGIPLTVGFVAKFYAVTAGVAAHLDIPVAALVIGSVIGLFYYLRIIVAMIAPQPATATAPGMVPLAGTAVMAVLAALLIAYGVYPAPLVALVRTTAVSLAFHHRPVPRAALDALPGKAPASVLRATERAAAGSPPTSGALR